MGWLNKYPDGGTVKPPKKPLIVDTKPINFVQQDNLRQLPMFDQKKITSIKEANKKDTRTYVGPSKEASLYEQKVNQIKKQTFADNNPNAKLVNNQLETINPDRTLTGTALSPNAKRFDKGLDHIVGGLEAAGYITGAGELYGAAKPLVKAGLEQAGKYLTEQTALKNAYKLNPLANKEVPLNVLYHNSNNPSLVFEDIDLLRTGKSQLKKRHNNLLELEKPSGFYTTDNPNSVFMGGSQTYAMDIPANAKVYDMKSLGRITDRISKSELLNLQKQGYDIIKGKNMLGLDEFIPLNKDKLLNFRNLGERAKDGSQAFAKGFYKTETPNWLKGYKEVPKPTSSQQVISTSSGMDAVNAIKPGYNSQYFVKQGYIPPTSDPRLMATLSEETVQAGTNNVGRGNISNVTSGAKPSTQTNTLGYKSEIDWAKWNKEIPANKALMKEYNTIEQASKANGTWMKNPDGSAFQGTPEQFVQQNSQNFKKAFPEGSENVFRGTGENISELRPNRSIFTANQELASGYAPYNKKSNFLNSESTEGGVHNFYRKNTKNSIELDGNNTSWTSVDLSNKRLTKDYFERNIKSQEDQIFKTKEYLSKMKQEPSGSWKAPDGTTYSNDLYKNTVAERELYLKDLKERYKNIDNLVSNPKELEEMRKVLGDKTTTDDIAAYIEKKNLDYVKLKNIEDSGVGDVTIVNHKPGNYLKSAIGNNGMFNMTNPNTYKALVPTVIGAGILQQKQQGGWLNNYK